jgi:glycosyltransferase involved in cell wall biosynthesis
VLAKAAVKDGWKVYVACEDTGRGSEISVEGIQFIDFPFSRSGTNPISEFKLYKRIRKLYSEIKPDVVHQITIKPVVYGSLAAQKEGVPGIVNAISGMGYMFTEGKFGFLQRFILSLMRKGANKKVSFIFQNQDDKETLQRFGVLEDCLSVNIVKGSGIDLNYFKYSPPHDTGERIKILFPSRMLWDKGVRELRSATEILKERYKNSLQFVLVGRCDNNNKSSVSESYMHEWEDGEYVVWKGHVNNMVDEYTNAHIVILPSYREGLPKSLIEACAIGRPIVTTDSIGCKDCVDEGINGMKVPVKNSIKLADALEKLINDNTLMVTMGINGRLKAEKEFDVADVIKKHLEIYNSYILKR